MINALTVKLVCRFVLCRTLSSPVKLAIFSLNPKQIATIGFFAFLLRTSIPIRHTKSRTRSDNAKVVYLCTFMSTNLHVKYTNYL